MHAARLGVDLSPWYSAQAAPCNCHNTEQPEPARTWTLHIHEVAAAAEPGQEQQGCCDDGGGSEHTYVYWAGKF
jgi:hypothetical protein